MPPSGGIPLDDVALLAPIPYPPTLDDTGPATAFLRPGDTVRIEVEGCGVLENPVIGSD